MSARADTCVYIDEAPLVRVHGGPARRGQDVPRACLGIDSVLTIFAPVDVLRTTLTAALEQLDALEQGQ